MRGKNERGSDILLVEVSLAMYILYIEFGAQLAHKERYTPLTMRDHAAYLLTFLTYS